MCIRDRDYVSSLPDEVQCFQFRQYYPFCTEDTFVEVSDEIVEAFLLDKRAEDVYKRQVRCHATWPLPVPEISF